MLIHSCVSVRSIENATLIFEKILGLELMYTFEIGASVLNTLFRIDTPAHARVYDTGNSKLEIFVIPDMPSPGGLQHICLGVPDRDAIAEKFIEAGLEVRRYKRPDGSVVFGVDRDGNLLELKTVPER